MRRLLQTRSLTVRIADTLVCQDLNLTVNSGEKWGILGVNGVGKTTLLHTLAGLRAPASGDIYYHDTTISNLSSRQRAQFRGVLFQDKSDPFPATVMESVLIGRHPHIDPWQWESQQDMEIAEQYINAMELHTKKQQLVSTLSGGERQRTAIAALLCQRTELLLLDEPTNHLDLKRQMEVMALFTQLIEQQQTASVMILHDLNIASRFCSKLLLLFGDGKFAQGDTEEMLSGDYLNDLYGYPIETLTKNSKKVFVPA